MPNAETPVPTRAHLSRRIRFGRRLKILRFELGIRQGQFARELGVSQNSVCRIEAGKRTYLAFEVMFGLFAFLKRHGVEVAWIAADSPDLPARSSPASPSAEDALPAPAVLAESPKGGG